MNKVNISINNILIKIIKIFKMKEVIIMTIKIKFKMKMIKRILLMINLNKSLKKNPIKKISLIRKNKVIIVLNL